MADQDFQIQIRTLADTYGIKQVQTELDKLGEQQRKLEAAAARGAPIAKDLLAGKPAGGESDPKKAKEAEKDAEDSGRRIGEILGRFAGAAVLFGIVRNVEQVAEELQKISVELDKQGSKLTENADKYLSIARAATSQEEVIKAAESAMGDVRAAHERVIEAQGQELTLYQKITDTIYHGVVNALTPWGKAAEDAGKISQKAHDVAVEGQERLLSIAEQNARAAIRTGQLFEQAFERRKAEPLSEALTELTGKIESLTAKQKALDPASKSYVKDWIDAGKQISDAEKQITALIRLDRDRTEFQKVYREGLDEEHSKEEEIERTMEHIVSILKSMGVEARTPAEAFAAGEKMAGALGEKVRQLATEWARAQDAARGAAEQSAKTLAKDLQTPTDKFAAEQRRAAAEHEAERAALEQKRREAVATGDTERAKAIQDELSHDTFARDQRKEALQRYVANQESLTRGAVPGSYEEQKEIGPEGQRKLNQARNELANIYNQERRERHLPSTAPESPPAAQPGKLSAGQPGVDPTVKAGFDSVVAAIEAVKNEFARQPQGEGVIGEIKAVVSAVNRLTDLWR